ncbi:Hypothetical_protein [Hexamita inflata]|uniref:Hypothetical_protein n=1 Tax=Hexamita inflata TaxID=28002 RepID=A0AA86QDE5_9EUKA|nr:Hypothetical protein HINF_LOCUS44766 [Hexamita inflata]
MTCTTLEFYRFGFFGQNYGNMSLQNASVTFSVQGAKFQYFGMVGVQSTSSMYTEVINMMTSVSYSSSEGNNVGSVFGYQGAKNCSIQNASVVGGNISSGSSTVGGIIGQQYNNLMVINSSLQNSNVLGSNSVGGIIGSQTGNATIQDSSVQNSNISISNYNVAGIIGSCISSELYLTNIQIKLVRISGVQNCGIVTGYDSGTHSFINSKASSNTINGVLQKDCTNLLNSKPVTGC